MVDVKFEKFMDSRGRRVRGYAVIIAGVQKTVIRKKGDSRAKGRYMVRCWGPALFYGKEIWGDGLRLMPEIVFRYLRDAKAKCREHSANLDAGITRERQDAIIKEREYNGD